MEPLAFADEMSLIGSMLPDGIDELVILIEQWLRNASSARSVLVQCIGRRIVAACLVVLASHLLLLLVAGSGQRRIELDPNDP